MKTGPDIAVRPLRGFTLIELIIAIVIMSILSFGTVQFMRNTGDAYSDAARRDRLGGTGRAALERMSRELRNALPNSIRVAASCVEFVPILAGSNYLSVPTLSASMGFSSIGFATAPSVDRAAVYPVDVDAVYQPSSVSVLSPPITTDAATLASADTVAVTWGTAHRFPADSPGRRWFMVTDPVSFCLDGAALYRYSDYGFSASQGIPASLPAILPTSVAGGRTLLATRVTTEGSAFLIDPATLQRNALVQFDLTFTEQGEGIRINHEVQLRNVP